MNSFIENVNYVAGLDNLYGSGIELYKNNLSLKSVQHDIELKFSYYNNDDKKIHSIVHSEPGVLVGGIDYTLLSFKTLVEASITGSEFTCTVSSSVQDFVINNIVIVNINIVSNSNIYKTYELEMKVVTAGAVTYDVFGEVKDSLKILPSLASITASDVDAMAKVYEIQEEVTTVASNIVGLNSIVSNMTEILLADDNATIATTKASEATASAVKAGKWSDGAYNVEVEIGRYSAKHWAVVAENALNKTAYSVETTEELINVPSGIDTVIVKDTNRGGVFVSKTEVDTDPKTGSLYAVDNGVVFPKLGGGFWARQYNGDMQIEWFDNNIDNIELKLSNFNINLNGRTIITTNMPYKNSYYNGIISENDKLYTKPKISKNHLWQGLFGITRSFSYKCKNFRIPGYDGWTIATHSATKADNFYTMKTNKGIKIFRINGSIVNDTVSLVANLPKKLSKGLIGHGCFIKTKINKGSGYNGDVFLTVNASNYLEQPITNNIGTYTNGNNIIKNIKLEPGENIIPCLVSNLYEQIAININISFRGASSENDYIEIEYAGLGLNNFFDVKKVDKDISKKYIAMSYSDGMQVATPTIGGSISKVANTATTLTDKVIHTQDIDLQWAISATCYDILGNDLEIYDVNDEVSKFAMIENLSNKNFTIRNNQDVTVGNRVLFHYVAEGVL